MRILVIEDEAKTARFLKKGLGEAGFVVNVASDGMDGLYLAQEFESDLIILDVMLPGLDGWQVLTRLRQEGQRAPVLLHRVPPVRCRSLRSPLPLARPFRGSVVAGLTRSLALLRGRGTPGRGIRSATCRARRLPGASRCSCR